MVDILYLNRTTPWDAKGANGNYRISIKIINFAGVLVMLEGLNSSS